MKFIIGSNSQKKIETAAKVIKQIVNEGEVEVTGYPARSQVSETPWDKETFKGACNRAVDCKSNIGGADYFIGLESGLVERYGRIFEEAWCCILDKNGKEYFGYSSGLKVPDYILKKMDELQMPHYKVMEILEHEHGLPNSDTWSNYSGKMIVRNISLEEALRNALIQIFSPKASFYQL